jgi:hypothetical protein
MAVASIPSGKFSGDLSTCQSLPRINNMKSDVAIVVPSCDSYADLWDILFYSIRQSWVPLGYPLYLVSNHKKYDDNGIVALNIGDDISWSDNLIKALAFVKEQYVLLYIDDLILYRQLDVKLIEKTIQIFIEMDGNYLRLNPIPRGVADGSQFDILPPGDLYRSSTVFSVWRRDILLQVLKQGESAWEFELIGSERTDQFNKWYSSKEWLVHYQNLVIKGKVDLRALRLLQNEGLHFKSNRMIMDKWDVACLRLRAFRSKLMSVAPRKYRRLIRSFIMSNYARSKQ